MDVSENRGFSPQIIHFNRVFHDFHHPFWGTPIFGNTHINPIKNSGARTNANAGFHVIPSLHGLVLLMVQKSHSQPPVGWLGFQLPVPQLVSLAGFLVAINSSNSAFETNQLGGDRNAPECLMDMGGCAISMSLSWSLFSNHLF